MLLVPAPPQLLEPLVPGRAGLVPGREAAAVRPGGPGLKGHDRLCGVREHFSVVRDEQDRLVGLADHPLQLAFGGHVEEVVRLVEHEDLVAAAQQQLEREPLLLAARERAQGPVLGLLPRQAEDRDGDGVAEDVELVAADLAPVGEGLRVVELGAGGVVLLHEPFGGGEALGGDPQRGRGQGHGQAPERREPFAHADELAHDAEPAAVGDGAGVGGEGSGDDVEQRGLARAVGADERDLPAFADSERDVGEQLPPVREVVADA